jgi:hypothetical protein
MSVKSPTVEWLSSSKRKGHHILCALGRDIGNYLAATFGPLAMLLP